MQIESGLVSFRHGTQMGLLLTGMLNNYQLRDKQGNCAKIVDPIQGERSSMGIQPMSCEFNGKERKGVLVVPGRPFPGFTLGMVSDKFIIKTCEIINGKIHATTKTGEGFELVFA